VRLLSLGRAVQGCLWSVLLVWLSTANAWAEDHPASLDSETTPAEFSFARSLFQKQYYYQAIIEFERFLYLYPDHPLTGEAEWMIARCYQEGKQFRKAIEQYRKIEGHFPGTALAADAAFCIGQTAYQAGEFEQSVVLFRRFMETFPADRRSAEATYRTGWAHIHLHEFVQAREIFTSLADRTSGEEANAYQEASKEILRGLTSIRDLKEKSPVFAGLLSAILPGAGHVYAGAYKDGLLAFVVNGALIGGAYEAFDKKVYVAGGIASLVGIGFYSGNIYGAVNSAHHTNKERLDALLQPLQKRYEDLSQHSDPWYQ